MDNTEQLDKMMSYDYHRCMISATNINEILAKQHRHSDDDNLLNRELGFLRTMSIKIRECGKDMQFIDATLQRCSM